MQRPPPVTARGQALRDLDLAALEAGKDRTGRGPAAVPPRGGEKCPHLAATADALASGGDLVPLGA